MATYKNIVTINQKHQTKTALEHIQKVSELLKEELEIEPKIIESEIIFLGENKEQVDTAGKFMKEFLHTKIDQKHFNHDHLKKWLDDFRKSEQEYHKTLAIKIVTKKKDIWPKSPGQEHYVNWMRQKDLVICQGPAGTGKTYLAVCLAVEYLLRNLVDRIILTRPAIEAGENLGFLPGTMKEKVDPYLRPIYDALYDVMGFEEVAKRIEMGQIEIAPLAFMRGRTLKRAFIILDEAQNATKAQMRMFLTRAGEGSKIVVCGDLSQSDLPAGSEGLSDSMKVLKDIQEIGIINLGETDIVRSKIVKLILNAYGYH